MPSSSPPRSPTISPGSSREVRAVRQRLAILGSTGSIGRQTLAVVDSLPDRFDV
ncbi:MAG: hypothetical protein QJR03_06530, partial [Sphaerobacter sp.]|nr:hypothetical protein [Sphaerobacter sp.]